MNPAKDDVICNVKAIRRAKGLSQAELADLVGVRRQAIYDMESGRYTPNTAIALRLARELNCRVEDLFLIDKDAGEQPVILAEHVERPGARLSVVRINDRLIAYPQDGRWLLSEGFQSADGLLNKMGGSVQMLRDEACLGRKILLLGCDPAFSILHAHVARQSGGAEILCRFASSRRAVEGLKAGSAHLAAAHLHNTGNEEANVLMAKSILGDAKATVVGFSLFEEGLMLAPGNPFGLKSVADLSKDGLRFINREHGAAIRVLLDDQLQHHGIPANTINGYRNVTGSHIEGAQAVAFGLADAALGLRAVAAAYRLDFLPIQFVRCDLIIGHEFLEHPAVKILLDVLQTGALRKDLESLPGYEAAMTGAVVGEV